MKGNSKDPGHIAHMHHLAWVFAVHGKIVHRVLYIKRRQTSLPMCAVYLLCRCIVTRFSLDTIATDRRGYPHNIFLIS